MDRNSQLKRRDRPRRKPHAKSVVTTIGSLSDDNLADILLRLPSPASLGRAALACKRWRRLATSRDFLRRYRALHPSPPLLGFFISFAHGLPVFHRVPVYSDRDLAAVARGSDFLLTSFTDGGRWYLEDCRDGLLLLSNSSDEELAVLDPISLRCVRMPFSATNEDWLDRAVTCFLPSSGCGMDEDRDSFRVLVCLVNNDGDEEVRTHVYSSGTGKWHPHKWVPAPVALDGYDCDCGCEDFETSPPMHAAGRIYWKIERTGCKVLLSLDTETMMFSYVALPPVRGLSSGSLSYMIGDTEDGACCLVSAPTPEHDSLRVWLRNENKGSWELSSVLQRSKLLNFFRDRSVIVKEYQVVAVIAGAVLLQICELVYYGLERHFFIALRMKNKPVDGGRITRVSTTEFDGKEVHEFYIGPARVAYPYFMTWPRPALLR